MPYVVHITDKALEEIDDAMAWYAARSMRAAVRWYLTLKKAIRSLEADPQRCPLAPESEWFGDVRQLLVGKKRAMYRVLFEIQGDTVYVLRVRHGAKTCSVRTICEVTAEAARLL